MQPQDTTQPALPLDFGPEFEDWRPIPGYEGFYEASDIGNIRRVKTGKGSRAGHVMRPLLHAHGYLMLSLYRDTKRKGYEVHRLVALTFLGPCPAGHIANHINGIKVDNRAANLAWVTPSENTRHAFTIGSASGLRGESHPNTHLTSEDVALIRAKRGLVTPRRLAEKFGVSRSAIYRIQLGRTWKHLPWPASP